MLITFAITQWVCGPSRRNLLFPGTYPRTWGFHECCRGCEINSPLCYMSKDYIFQINGWRTVISVLILIFTYYSIFTSTWDLVSLLLQYIQFPRSILLTKYCLYLSWNTYITNPLVVHQCTVLDMFNLDTLQDQESCEDLDKQHSFTRSSTWTLVLLWKKTI